MENALTIADAHLSSNLWEEALHVLEQLPAHLKSHHLALRRRIDALTGMQRWTRALALAKQGITQFPLSTDLWLRQARLQAQAGDLPAARMSVSRCIELDPGMRDVTTRDEGLRGIW